MKKYILYPFLIFLCFIVFIEDDSKSKPSVPPDPPVTPIKKQVQNESYNSILKEDKKLLNNNLRESKREEAPKDCPSRFIPLRDLQYNDIVFCSAEVEACLPQDRYEEEIKLEIDLFLLEEASGIYEEDEALLAWKNIFTNRYCFTTAENCLDLDKRPESGVISSIPNSELCLNRETYAMVFKINSLKNRIKNFNEEEFVKKVISAQESISNY